MSAKISAGQRSQTENRLADGRETPTAPQLIVIVWFASPQILRDLFRPQTGWGQMLLVVLLAVQVVSTLLHIFLRLSPLGVPISVLASFFLAIYIWIRISYLGLFARRWHAQ